MSNAIIGALRIVLGLDSAAFEKGATGVQKTLNKAAREWKAVGEQLTGLGEKLSLAFTAPFAVLAVQASKAATESAQALGQVQTALASMNGASGKTVEQLQNIASHLQDISLYDDDDILRQVTANLLTFGNISGDVFDRAEQSIVDMSARLGQDLQSSTIQLGKALNDPIKGITALRKIGVSFTEDQENQIKTMLKHGETAKAQGLILDEVAREFSGSAKAMRDADPFAALAESGRNFKEAIGGIVNTAIVPLVDAATKAVNAFNNLSTGTQTFIVGIAGVAAVTGPVLVALGSLANAFGAISAFLASDAMAAALPAISAALGPLALAAAAVAAIFIADWPKISPVLADLWKTAQQSIGGPLVALFTNLSDRISSFWNSEGGAALRQFADYFGTALANEIRQGGEMIINLISGVLKALNDFVNYFGDVISFVDNLIHGRWEQVWQSFKNIINDGIEFVIHAIGAIVPAVGNAMQAAYNKVAGLIGLSGDTASASMTTAMTKTASALTAAAPHMAKAAKVAISDPVDKAVAAAKKAVENAKWTVAKYTPTTYAATEGDLTKTELGKVPDKDIGVGETEQSLLDSAKRIRDGYKAAWADIGQAFKGAAQEWVYTGKLNWQRLVVDMMDNWKSVMSVLTDLWNKAQAGMAASKAAGGSGGIGSFITSVLGAIGKNADGTDNWRGGLSLVGERGPEVVNLPRGAQVIPNHKLGNLGGASSSPVFSFDLRGAVMTDDLLKQMNDIGANYGHRAAVAGAQGGAQIANVNALSRERRQLR